ncbi:MAG: cytochrome c [candidate division Zixibacteria bacterium]|nr:cytochrome c [candidate division Zixibacteria bacterium]
MTALTRYKFLFGTLSLLIIALLLTVGCTREQPSDEPPIHLNPDMDNQPKYKAQSESKFFADSAAMRQPVAGTVARGNLREDNIFYTGAIADSQFVKKNPVLINMQLLKRGRERFDIYCSPCHSRVGDGRGIMVTRGYVPPPSFHDDRLRSMPDGQIFDVITNGIRNMPSYRHQITPDDRWAIVAYLRALQRSRNAGLEDIPVELKDKVR